MIGKRLRLARASAGLSLRDLEERIDNLVTAQAIGKYERDEMMPGSKALIAIASALTVSEDYLLSSGDLELEDVEFRKKAVASKKDEAQVQGAVLNWLERYLTVEEVIQAPSREWDRPREAPYPTAEIAAAELAAKSLREHWSLGTDRIPDFAEFLEERGVKVLCHALPETVSGFTCWVRRAKGEQIPVIVINERDTGERQRFTLAHELGHMTLDIAEDVDEERASNRFASAFLMPAETLWSEIGKHRTTVSLGELFALKLVFGVSVQAIAFRCKDLGIIGQGEATRLFKLFSRLGWRSPPFPEPEPLAKEQPGRFRRLCFRALAEDAISEARTAELLGISVRQLNQEMDGPIPVAA
jgi:Zn-dependent peptidase ImmA (M78 family)